MTRSTIVAFADSAVAIDAIGERAVEAVEFACRHIGTNAGPASERLVVRCLDGKSMALVSREEVLFETPNDGRLVEVLMQQVTLRLVDRSLSGGHLHGAFVVRDGRGLLLPGQSGSGKSTLAAWLSTRGFALASDELAHFPLGACEFAGLTRPIHLKRGAMFGALARTGERTDWLACGEGELLHPEALGGSTHAGSAPLGVIVFPEWAHGADDDVEALSPANVARRLLELLANARNLPGHGLPEAARIARSVRGYRIAYGSLESAGRLLSSVGIECGGT